jgi:hypothetical protein
MSHDKTVLTFLSLFEADIKRDPERLKPMPAEMIAQMEGLTQGMNFDPDEPIEGDVDL